MFHPVVTQIKQLLEASAVPYKFFEHEAVRTSEEAHALRPEYVLSQGAKALIIKCKIPNAERKFIMCVIPGDQRLDGEKVKALVGAKSITFATKEEADVITNRVEFGGVPPFGNLFGIPVYLDPKLEKIKKLFLTVVIAERQSHYCLLITKNLLIPLR